MSKVRADKLREAAPGTMAPGSRIRRWRRSPSRRSTPSCPVPNQLHVTRDDVAVSAPGSAARCREGAITEAGMRHNIRVGVQYLEAWLGGNGCVPLYHLMEDAATAEICRAQLWQWLHHGARTAEGR